MVVTRSNFEAVVRELQQHECMQLDCETTGLRPYHGSRLFSLILTPRIAGVPSPRYFNFQPYQGLDSQKVLRPSHLAVLKAALFSQPHIEWEIHNARYDLAILAAEGIDLEGPVWCSYAMARVQNNEHMQYDLASCGERIGETKDDTVEKYIKAHKLWTWEQPPGKKARKKNLHYDRVPFEIISNYGLIDGHVGSRVADRQKEAFAVYERDQQQLPPKRRLSHLVANEKRLTKVVFNMERRGVLIDREYTSRALAYESDRVEKATHAFRAETGKTYSASPNLFKDIFLSEKNLWVYGELTKTGQLNPSFESSILERFSNPAAKHILTIRDAKSKADFYAGFLYHADSKGVVHPSLNPAGTRTGRFSSSEPNLQNLTDEEGKEDQEFLVRRAIIPRPGFLFIMPDYDQMEYRMMLDYANEEALIAKVLAGLDVHTATAEMMGVERKPAKTLNFMLLYGGGVAKLCLALFKPSLGESMLKELADRYLYERTDVEAKTLFAQDVIDYNLAELRKADTLRKEYFKALPGVERFIKETKDTVHQRKELINWAGRVYQFPNPRFAYTGPNTLIQGGTADVNKFGLVKLDEYLASKKSKLVLTIHDENPIEVHEDEVDEVPQVVKEIMQSIYPARRLPLTVGMEYSTKSLGDKIKGFPSRGAMDGRSGAPSRAEVGASFHLASCAEVSATA